MKKLITTIILFVSPIIVYLVALEIVVGRIPNSYNYKYNFIKTQGESFEAIAMGHSQLYDDFYPRYFDLPAFNLSNSNQTYEDNYYLLEELLPFMPNLKVVIFPIGYFDVGEAKQKDEITDRSRYYHKYMNIDYSGRLPLKYKYECLNPRLATNKVYQYYVQHVDMVGCDSLGTRNNHHLKDRPERLGFGKLNRYTVKANTDLCIRGMSYLERAIQMLVNSGIKVVLVSPPYYWGNYKGTNKEQKVFVKKAINKLCDDYPIVYVDLEENSSFKYDDFYDETHLNEIGGEKFTRILNKNIFNN